jgi:molybdopterin synthase catalytic subunit
MADEDLDRQLWSFLSSTPFSRFIAGASSHTITGVLPDRVELLLSPIDIADSIEQSATDQAGGIAVFLGVTRAERDDAGRDLVALDYEAYEAMAAEQLRQLAGQARARWHIERLVLLHRLGRVAVGEPSVLIAVAAAHRGEAFAACQWLIDTLKADAAIWKKEVWNDGAHSWVDPATPKRATV